MPPSGRRCSARRCPARRAASPSTAASCVAAAPTTKSCRAAKGAARPVTRLCQLQFVACSAVPSHVQALLHHAPAMLPWVWDVRPAVGAASGAAAAAAAADPESSMPGGSHATGEDAAGDDERVEVSEDLQLAAFARAVDCPTTALTRLHPRLHLVVLDAHQQQCLAELTAWCAFSVA